MCRAVIRLDPSCLETASEIKGLVSSLIINFCSNRLCGNGHAAARPVSVARALLAGITRYRLPRRGRRDGLWEASVKNLKLITLL